MTYQLKIPIIDTKPTIHYITTTPTLTDSSSCVVSSFTSPQQITTNWGKYEYIDSDDSDDNDDDDEPTNKELMTEIGVLKKQIENLIQYIMR